jgi:hypothetical protein
MTDPQQISDYRVVDVLGRGGMGVVYEAVHASTGATAAVKTVRVATESTLESIRREIQTLRELRHPGVVAIREDGVAEGVPWYAMDLLRGRTLRDDFRAWFPELVPVDATTRDLLKPGRLRADAVAGDSTSTPPYSIAHVATVFRNLCEPLTYVHGQGVIHRDLSPGNIFLTGADEVVLFDFGLAAQFRTDSARAVLEISGHTRGTAHYMSPEQARGEVVDARADVYALGCILYEALTGRPPFLGDSSLTVLMRHIEDIPERPSQHAPAVPAALDELVMRMLAKAPRDRIGYVEDVAAILEELATTTLAVSSRPRPRAYTYRAGLAGRTELLGVLDGFLLRLAGGIGGCACLIGESGAGKTRLAGEIASRAIEHEIRVITGECEPIGAAPLHPLRPLLRAVADRCREGGAAEVERLLGGSGGLLAAYEPSLAGFGAATEHRAGPSALGTAALRFRVLGALREVLRAHAKEEPILLVLDDVQWADELTLALLASLGADFLAAHGLFIFVTVRAEEMTPELDAALRALGASRFEVPRLDRAAVGSMVRDMLALEEDAPTLTEFVASRSAGNPLFAAEYVRTAVDEGVLQRDQAGRWRLADRDADSFDALPTPGSVHALLHRRLRSLTAPARVIALAASVIGRACDGEMLAATADLGADASRLALQELIQRHVVEELGDGQLRFTHAKLREEAYGELPDVDRRALHFAELAHHWEQAGERARAIDYLERAAEHALQTAAYGEARTLLRRLVELGATEPPIRRARWDRWLGEACYAIGDLAGCATHTQHSLERLGRRLPSSNLGWTATVMGGIGRQIWSRTVGRRRARTGSDANVEAALASARMTSCYFFNDDSLGLMGAALIAVNLAERADEGVAIAEIYGQLGYVAGLAKLRGVAKSYFAQARATASATRDPLGLGKALYSEAAYHVGIGAWPEAVAAASEGLAIARVLRDPQEAEVAHTILGHVEFATGAYAASRLSAELLYDSARARANAQHEAWGIYTRARAALYVGDLAAAIRDFDRARALLQGQSDQASQILCAGMLASALARTGDLSRARVLADETTALIGGKTPPVFTIAEGFVGAADAYLELWARGDASVAPAARTAIANLARLARIYQLRRGAARRATRSLRRGLALAETLAMPYDQARAHHALACAGIEDHAERARALFAQLGCTITA